MAAGALLLAGCTTSTSGGPQSPAAPPHPSASRSAVSIAPATSAPLSTATPELASLCPDATTTRALTSCLGKAIGTYWSGQLNALVTEPVVFHPVASRMPKSCRAALEEARAFTCPADGKLYVTGAFVTKLDSMFSGAQRSYAFAVVQAHELGHVVQLRVHQSQIEDKHPTAAVSQFIEQQADCLSGVWAHAATRTLGLNPAQFRTVAQQVFTSISSKREIATHGTPGQRLAAIDRGLQGGRPQTCRLASFH